MVLNAHGYSGVARQGTLGGWGLANPAPTLLRFLCPPSSWPRPALAGHRFRPGESPGLEVWGALASPSPRGSRRGEDENATPLTSLLPVPSLLPRWGHRPLRTVTDCQAAGRRNTNGVSKTLTLQLPVPTPLPWLREHLVSRTQGRCEAESGCLLAGEGSWGPSWDSCGCGVRIYPDLPCAPLSTRNAHTWLRPRCPCVGDSWRLPPAERETVLSIWPQGVV